MIRSSIFTVMVIVLCLSEANAQVFKCVESSGTTVYSDKPCKEEGEEYKQLSLDIKSEPLSDVGFSKYTRGMISGYTGPFLIKDSVAHFKRKDNSIHVDLWLYPFVLNSKEVALVNKGALIGRGEKKPARFNFSFPANLSNDIPYEDIVIDGLFLDNGTFIAVSADQWVELVESIKFEYLPKGGKIVFEAKGKIDDYSLSIHTKSYVYDRQTDLINKEWDASFAEKKRKYSVFGSLNYPYEIRPDLLSGTPYFSIKDLRNGKWIGSGDLHYDAFTYKYSIGGLKPSRYRLSVALENSTEFRWSAIKPGELFAKKEFVIEDEQKPVRADIDMISVIHLLKPVNNNYHTPGDGSESHSSPIEFVWKPLSDGTVYKCIIQNLKSMDVHTEIDTSDSSLIADLNPGLYRFALSAYVNGIKSGEMRIHNDQSYRFDYRFLVKD